MPSLRFREGGRRRGTWEGTPGDGILNSLGDILGAALGFAIAVRVVARGQRGWALVLFVGAELISALWIRDSMLLTTLMLVYPVPAVRQWQVAG